MNLIIYVSIIIPPLQKKFCISNLCIQQLLNIKINCYLFKTGKMT